MSDMATVAVPETTSTRWHRLLLVAGWLVSLAPVYIVLSSARWKLTSNPWYVREFVRIGWDTPALPLLASLQLAAIVLYLIPPTAVLGAVLLTGYLGGAIASYVRIGESSPPLVPFTTAVLAWLGLWLREPRLRALLPFRRTAPFDRWMRRPFS
jgi:hypothetical protein